MKLSRLLAVPVLAVICLAGANTRAAAQISISIGVAPVCPYGYFNYAPYQCAPFGYYGPQWFTGGVFLGAGPWFRGPVGFHGYVNHATTIRALAITVRSPCAANMPTGARHRGWEHALPRQRVPRESATTTATTTASTRTMTTTAKATTNDGNDHDDHGHMATITTIMVTDTDTIDSGLKIRTAIESPMSASRSGAFVI